MLFNSIYRVEYSLILFLNVKQKALALKWDKPEILELHNYEETKQL